MNKKSVVGKGMGRPHHNSLIGREREWTHLLDFLQQVEQGFVGQPQCIFLVGEAGIGKTRLAKECEIQGSILGWQVFWGQGFPHLQASPYHLWRNLLESLGLQESGTPHPLGAPAHLQLWDQVAQALINLAAQTPVLIILDDLGECDSLSRDLLRYLCHQIRGYSIALVGTLREEIYSASDNPLQLLLASLRREQTLFVCEINPLSNEAIDQLVMHCASSLPEEQRRRICLQSAGNPFFAEELARYCLTSNEPGSKLPLTITAVLDQRLKQTDSECRSLLEKAAVLGSGFSFKMLLELAQTAPISHEEQILDTLEQALCSRLLTEEGTRSKITYHFWHPLLANHLYEHIPERDRAYLHRLAAEFYCDQYRGREEEGAATITHHLLRGAAPASLIARYAWYAGCHAYKLCAYPEAGYFFRLALGHISSEEILPVLFLSSDVIQGILWELIGECAMGQGKYEEASRGYEQALAFSRSSAFGYLLSGSYLCEYQALLCREQALTYWYRGNRKQAWKCYEIGAGILHKSGITGGSAWACLFDQAASLFWQEGQYEQALFYAQEALALFQHPMKRLLENAQQSLEDPLASLPLSRIRQTLMRPSVDIGRVHVLLAALLTTVGKSKEASSHLMAALTIFEQCGSQREVMVVCNNLGDLSLRRAEFTRASSYLQRAQSLAERIGSDSSLIVSLANLGILSARCGNLQEGEVLLKKSLSIAKRVADPVYLSLVFSHLAPLLLEQGKTEEAQYYLRQAFCTGRKIPSCVGTAFIKLGWMRILHVLSSHEEKLVPQAGGHCCCPACQRLLEETEASIRRILHLPEIEAETRAEGLIISAYAAFLLGAVEEARQRVKNACQEAEKYDLVWLWVQGERLLAQIEAQLGYSAQADQRLEEICSFFHQWEMRLEMARTLSLHGTLLCWRAIQPGRGDEQQRGRDFLKMAQHLAGECQAELLRDRTAWLFKQAHLLTYQEAS